MTKFSIITCPWSKHESTHSLLRTAWETMEGGGLTVNAKLLINWESRKDVHVGRNQKYLLSGSTWCTMEWITFYYYTQRNKLTRHSKLEKWFKRNMNPLFKTWIFFSFLDFIWKKGQELNPEKTLLWFSIRLIWATKRRSNVSSPHHPWNRLTSNPVSVGGKLKGRDQTMLRDRNRHSNLQPPYLWLRYDYAVRLRNLKQLFKILAI